MLNTSVERWCVVHGKRLWVGFGPTVLVMPIHASAEDFEQGLDLFLGMGAIDDGEGAAAKSGGHLAGVVADGFFAFDDDGRRGRSESGEQVEDAGAGFFGLGA